eukprot:scaffold32615_cov70-Phaeocystis_antarctica.AAC.5
MERADGTRLGRRAGPDQLPIEAAARASRAAAPELGDGAEPGARSLADGLGLGEGDRCRSSTAPGRGQRGTVSTHARARWGGCVASAPGADRPVPWVLASRRSEHRWGSRTQRGLSGQSASASATTRAAAASARTRATVKGR